MLNNQKLKNKNIDYVPYDLQISIFNAKCKGCSCAVYKVRRKTGLILSFIDYKDAITYAMNNKIPLNRFCTFSDEIVTMSEIVHNHCMFWDIIPVNPKEDTEVREITEEKLAQLLVNLAKLKE